MGLEMIIFENVRAKSASSFNLRLSAIHLRNLWGIAQQVEIRKCNSKNEGEATQEKA